MKKRKFDGFLQYCRAKRAQVSGEGSRMEDDSEGQVELSEIWSEKLSGR